MKLMIVIIRDTDTEAVGQALIGEGFRVTRVASTGGFLRRGSTTLMIGMENERIDQAIELIRESLSPQTDPGVSRATLFVIDVEHFHQV